MGKPWTLVARKGTSRAPPLTQYGGEEERELSRAFAGRIEMRNGHEGPVRPVCLSCASILCVYPVCLSCVYPNRGHPCVHLLLQFVM